MKKRQKMNVAIFALTNSIASALLPVREMRGRFSDSTSISSAAPRHMEDTAPGSSPDVTKTVESLQRLLQKQEGDALMTKQLLNTIESGGNFENPLESEIYKSFVSGFDYGFISRSEGAGFAEVNSDLPGYVPPGNVWRLGWDQFFRNLDAMNGEYKATDGLDTNLTLQQKDLRSNLEALTLSNEAIWEREKETGIRAPLVVKVPYLMLCYFLDIVFDKKYVFARFFFLETVARMPYFSYISMMHLYETLGFWRRGSELKKIHHAEELNEFHHLMIQESLGGDQAWWVRFLAQHAAILYYVVLCVLWLLSPSLSFFFSRCLETHAVHTYGQFLEENEEALKNLPPPLTAIEYYTCGSSDPYYVEFQIASVATGKEIRRPGLSMTTLHDVFMAIQADEGDHVIAMDACLDPNVPIVSPSIEKRFLTGAALATVVAAIAGSGQGEIPLGLGDLPSGEFVDSLLAVGATVATKVFGSGTPVETATGMEEVAEGVGLATETFFLEKIIPGAIGAVIAGVLGLANWGVLDDDDDDDDDDDPANGNCTSSLDSDGGNGSKEFTN